MPKKGAVVLVPFPFTNLTGTKVRPAVVVSTRTNGSDVIVAFITSKTGRVGNFSVLVRTHEAQFEKTGLKGDSVIRVDKLATLERSVLLGELGEVSRVCLKKVDAALRKIFVL